MSATQLLIFDVDGTLVDSQDVIVEAQRRTFLAHDLPVPDRAAALSVVGLSLREAFVVLAGADAPVDSLAEHYKQAFNDQRADTQKQAPFFPGALDAIARFGADDGFLLGVATGKSRRGVAHLFARTGWASLFATVQTADDHPSKPAPDMILAALAETGIEPGRAVMIGDTSYDMAMARAAGVRAIGVSWGYHVPADLLAAGAEIVISDFSQLDALVANGNTVPSPRPREG
jgi:phosphoglycolate phosphatase